MQTLEPSRTDTPTETRLLTRAGLAAHTSLSQRYVDTLTKNGTLPYFKIGKSIRYIQSEIDQALRERFHIRAKARRSESGTVATTA
jgi:predicted DNA-binding transcriptional regulator AlpA